MHTISAISPEDCAEVLSAETALVRAAQEDLTAFAPLYERYRDRIYAYLRTRTRSAEDAADLTQQVFLQALDALPRYRPQRVPFAARLVRIARNAATAPGVTQAALVAALAAPDKAALDVAVAAGQITPAQETAGLAALQAQLTTLISTPMPGK